ncbi:hypothetical protein ACE6H2_010221 [Prunus campanulata]
MTMTITDLQPETIPWNKFRGGGETIFSIRCDLNCQNWKPFFFVWLIGPSFFFFFGAVAFATSEIESL